MATALPVVPKNRRYAVIMAGGSGTRFWPWSRRDNPKQLLPLCGSRSMLADTVKRISRVVPRENVIVVVNAVLGDAVARDLPDLAACNILREPVGRNTAACIAWAAMEIRCRAEDAVMVVLPADHSVSPMRAFVADMRLALAVADSQKSLVTFGIRPTHAETGYGYLRAGTPLARPWPERRLRKVAAFIEKPNLARAKKFLDDRRFCWNSGMFAWRCDVIQEEISRYVPALAEAMAGLDQQRRRGRISKGVLNRVYRRLDSISIDHAVMEKSRRVVMLMAAFCWSDIGSWDAVSSLWPQDRDGNASRDPLVAIDSRENVVATGGKPVALLGVSGLAIVDAGDALLICPRNRAQDVRAVVMALDAAGLGDLS